jgi:hypothetical protein
MKTIGAERVKSVRPLRRPILAWIAAALVSPGSAGAGEKAVTIKLTDTRFECKNPMFSTEPGFERCELYTVPRFTAPPDAVLRLFGHCDATIRYKTRDGIIESRGSLYERFDAAIVDGSGLAPVTMILKPTRLLLDPIIEAQVTDLRCSIDEVFD